jgi:hypothetical protein
VNQPTFALGIRVVELRERDDEHAERRELGREGLGRRDADLRTRARQHHELGFADQRAFGTLQIASCER